MTVLPGSSRGQVRRLARSDLAEVLAPLADFVARKIIQLRARSRGIEFYDAWLVELRHVQNDKDRELAIMEELEEQRMESAIVLRDYIKGLGFRVYGLEFRGLVGNEGVRPKSCTIGYPILHEFP